MMLNTYPKRTMAYEAKRKHLTTQRLIRDERRILLSLVEAARLLEDVETGI